jgi:hypothetical protein
MFTNRETALAVRESALMVAALLTRSYTHVVLPSDAAPKEKTAYRQTIESLTRQLQDAILEHVAEMHADLAESPYTIQVALKTEGLDSNV